MIEKKITKSNALVEASYRLSLNELRIVLYGLAHINPYEDEFPLFHRISVRELAEFYNIGEKQRGSFYDDIKHALLTKFWEREFSYFDAELNEIVKQRWLIQVRHGRKDGTLAYHYNPMIQKHLQKLARNFTTYSLEHIAQMKSAYAMRLYEMCIMHLNASQQSKTSFSKEISELKNHLGITEKYKHFYHFKPRVLEKSKSEINEYSDINFSYKAIKLGRAVHQIQFTVSKKNPRAKPVPLRTLAQKMCHLPPAVLEQAKAIVLNARTGWDVYAIEQQFYAYVNQKGVPEHPEQAFLGFVRKKVAGRP